MHTRLKKMRIDNDLSAAALADKLFIDKSSISKWENGKAQPSLDVIKQYSKLFNRSIDWIVSGKADAKNERVKTTNKNEEEIKVDIKAIKEKDANDDLKEIKELLKEKNDLSTKSMEEIASLKEMVQVKTTKKNVLVRKVYGNDKVKYYGNNIKDLAKDANAAYNIHLKIICALVIWMFLITIAMIIKLGFDWNTQIIGICSISLLAPMTYSYLKKNKVLSDFENGTYKSSYKNNISVFNYYRTDEKVSESEFDSANIAREIPYNIKRERKKIRKEMTNPFNSFLLYGIAFILLLLATRSYIFNDAGMSNALDDSGWGWFVQSTLGATLIATFILYTAFTPASINNIILNCVKKKYLPEKYKLVITKNSILIPVNNIYPVNIGFVEIGYDIIRDMDYRVAYADYSTLTFNLRNNAVHYITMNKNDIYEIQSEVNRRLIAKEQIETVDKK